MTDENPSWSDQIPEKKPDGELQPNSRADEQQRILALLEKIDLEAAEFRIKMSALQEQVIQLGKGSANEGNQESLVTQLREANQNLVMAALDAQVSREKAETANQKQEEFLSMLAHELRAPLAPIAMAGQLLGDLTQAHPALPKLQGIIARQVGHMTTLVNDLLDAARVSSGNITLKKSPSPLSEIILSAVEEAQPFVEKRMQKLTVDMPPEPIVVDGDPVRLAQVFANLLINAVKFTPEYGRISVSVSRLAQFVSVSVKDNGMGIGQDIQPFIFDLFKQGITTLDRSQGGLGIGLSLVRTIVEMHGGSVSVQSAGLGTGSDFVVVLPIAVELAAYRPDPASPAIHPQACRILLIEDNPDANETLSDYLKQEGHSVSAAFDGKTGLAMAIRDVYDVIICDVGLPGMDGYEVVQGIRRHGVLPAPCIIAVTGYGRASDQTRAEQAGFDHFLVKPVATDVLMKIIATSVPLQ